MPTENWSLSAKFKNLPVELNAIYQNSGAVVVNFRIWLRLTQTIGYMAELLLPGSVYCMTNVTSYCEYY